MKKSSKNNFSGKNSKQYTKNSDSTSYFKNKNSSKKENKFRANSSLNQIDNKFYEIDKKKRNFSSLKGRKPVSNSNIEVSNKKDIVFHLAAQALVSVGRKKPLETFSFVRR